jgi:hypothetical protein
MCTPPHSPRPTPSASRPIPPRAAGADGCAVGARRRCLPIQRAGRQTADAALTLQPTPSMRASSCTIAPAGRSVEYISRELLLPSAAQSAHAHTVLCRAQRGGTVSLCMQTHVLRDAVRVRLSAHSAYGFGFGFAVRAAVSGEERGAFPSPCTLVCPAVPVLVQQYVDIGPGPHRMDACLFPLGEEVLFRCVCVLWDRFKPLLRRASFRFVLHACLAGEVARRSVSRPLAQIGRGSAAVYIVRSSCTVSIAAEQCRLAATADHGPRHREGAPGKRDGGAPVSVLSCLDFSLGAAVTCVRGNLRISSKALSRCHSCDLCGEGYHRGSTGRIKPDEAAVVSWRHMRRRARRPARGWATCHWRRAWALRVRLEPGSESETRRGQPETRKNHGVAACRQPAALA